MKCELVKMRIDYLDSKKVERFFYQFFLVFENGNVQRISPNVYSKDSKTFDNRVSLNALAREVFEYCDIKYVG